MILSRHQVVFIKWTRLNLSHWKLRGKGSLGHGAFSNRDHTNQKSLSNRIESIWKTWALFLILPINS